MVNVTAQAEAYCIYITASAVLTKSSGQMFRKGLVDFLHKFNIEITLYVFIA
jgi:hypothetical protein